MRYKLFLLIILGYLTIGGLRAQTLNHAEYSFDTVAPVGTGIPISVTPGDVLDKNLNFDVTGLEEGFHWVYIRARDDIGRWGLPKGHKFYVYEDAYGDNTVVQPDIAGFEYAFDRDPGVGNGTWVAATGSDVTKNLDFVVDTLNEGFHRMLVRSKDAGGKWGLFRMYKIYVFNDVAEKTLLPKSKLVAAEYYFDYDTVPFGRGNSLDVSEGNSINWTGLISVDGLPEGGHKLFIRVRDSVGVWSIAYAKQFNVVDLVSETNSPICAGAAAGIATVHLKGGVRPYTFLWNDPLQQKDSVATGLKPGTYTVTVTDAKGAVIKEPITITAYNPIKLKVTTANTNCNEAKGSAAVMVESGGIAPFRYKWSNGSDAAHAYNLRSGTYHVSVTDQTGCAAEAIASISDVNGPVITLAGKQDLKCAGNENGVIAINVTGGSGTYKFNWSNGSQSQNQIGLKAGPYELTVSDNLGCVATGNFTLTEPDPFTYDVEVVPSGCGLATGSAAVTLYGGTKPYGYSWESGGFTNTKENLPAGSYKLTVTDANLCQTRITVAVSDVSAPAVTVTEIYESSCGKLDGAIYTSVGGSGSFTYQWKRESVVVGTQKNLTGVGPGDYSITVTSGACKTVATAVIPADLPPVQPICLVTVDTASGRNLVAWTKTAGLGITAYKIYRETSQANLYSLIATQPYSSPGAFVDTLADPMVRSWRYKLSAVDGCGNESRLSLEHKTMHLVLGLGLANSINLIWNNYEGFLPFNNSYNIWRFSNGNWSILTSVPSNLNTYTDWAVPAGNVWYYVEAVHPAGCNITKKAESLNATRSNRQSKLDAAPLGTEDLWINEGLTVYPNPGKGVFNLSLDLDGRKDVGIKVFDISGKLVLSSERSSETSLNIQIDLSDQAAGVYHLHLNTDDQVYHKILVIQ